MKSEFLLAFNEIAELRKLPREVVMDALSAALISAYRRDTGVPPTHEVEVRFDEKTGAPAIWAQKTVVEDVEDAALEVSLKRAREFEPDADLGEEILVESTPDGFGRIAAQTAKQVILQRMREAERDAQYEEYMERVGDLVTGTVQNDNGDVVTISLGRSEAILPRSQQMPGERYRMHDKVRAYVMEVRRTNRGPQIVVSRTHRNVLRRLLEYEVPEIYNGAVEIKSIAREPGARSKVAVAANQPGADPVGACVGMRGIRIQSIVKELSGEKIDVIEWNPEQEAFISKSLSPARVSAVFLDDDPDSGRTATVIVPDDQLSLAIGREGQNARLAAKLTGWRIDIKSIAEAAMEAYERLLSEPDLDEIARENVELVAEIGDIIEKKRNDRPVMPEEYSQLVRFLNLVEGERTAIRSEEIADRRAEIAEAREQVPENAYEIPLDYTDLPLSVYNILTSGGYENAGQVIEQFLVDPNGFRSMRGFNNDAADAVAAFVNDVDIDDLLAEVQAEIETLEEEEPVEEQVEPDVEPEQEEEPEEEPVEAEMVLEETLEEEEEGASAPEEDEDILYEDDLARQRREEIVARLAGGGLDLGDLSHLKETERDFGPEDEPEEEPAASAESAIDDDRYFDDEEGDEDDEDLQRRRNKQRRRQLVYDEDLGRVVSRRRRKGGRAREAWSDFTMDDLDDFLEYDEEDDEEEDDE